MIQATDKRVEENPKKRDRAREDMKSRRPVDPAIVDAAEDALIDQDIPVETGVRPNGAKR
jgi:hypothetical protein